ncbi:MAG: hypothetical protein EOR07_24005 [Mesorhizobium sp.]|nr:MAG: hypothetical protein EOR07_24005 [Mesorhizobium sp.]
MAQPRHCVTKVSEQDWHGQNPVAGCKPPRFAEPSLHFVILGRSKERSDAAQTLGSMPLPKPKNAAAQNRTPTTRSAKKLPLRCRSGW